MYMKDMEALDAILRSGADLQTVCEHKDMYDFESIAAVPGAHTTFITFRSEASRKSDVRFAIRFIQFENETSFHPDKFV